MNWVRSAVQVYRDINPSTLSGAIDVIVVERPVGGGLSSEAVTAAAADETEMACSPFHVRFGKLSVLRPVDKKVRITVNDEPVPFFMKVGETGEAFFVFETDADVPEELQTSPLAGPVGDDTLRGDDGEEMEPEFLDLSAPQEQPTNDTPEGSVDEADADPNLSPLSSPPSSPTSSRYASFPRTAINSPTHTIRSLPSNGFLPAFSSLSVSSPKTGRTGAATTTTDNDEDEQRQTRQLKDAPPVESNKQPPAKDEGKAPHDRPVRGAMASAAESMVSAGGGALHMLAHPVSAADELLHQVPKRDEQAGDDEEGEMKQPKPEKEDEPEGRNALPEHDADESAADEGEPRREDPGEDVRRLARKRELEMISLDPVPLAQGQESTPRLPHQELQGNELVLDMDGYKIESENAPEPAAAEGALADHGAKDGGGPSMLGLGLQGDLDEAAASDIIAFAQGLLQASDPAILQRFMNPASSPLAAASDDRSRASSPVPSFILDDEDALASLANLSNFSNPAGSVRASSPTTSTRTTRGSSPQGRPMSISSLQSLQPSAPQQGDGISPAAESEGIFVLKSGGRVHRFELSLCGAGGAFGTDRAMDEQAFIKKRISYAQFIDPDSEAIAENADLILRYQNRYHSWDTAAPILASLAVYRRSLVEHNESVQTTAGDEKPAKAGWGAWWRGRSTSRAGETETSSLPPLRDGTPAVSPPASPRSLPVTDEDRAAVIERLDQAIAGTPIEDEADLDVVPNVPGKHYAKTLRLTSDQLKSLGLRKGANTISFSVRSSYSGYATCTSRIFLWDSDFHVVISDIDGTITKSDALGHVFTMIGRDWTHLGVAKLYTDIARNGYKVMYLTSRAIGQADTTREYLKGIKQNGFILPEGPVIMSPDRLMTSLHREVIMRKPEVFKMACLRDIARLFGDRSPFYAGFGNRITDALSYRSVEIPSSRIFTIDTNGEVKMELLDLAGYKSSYIHMTDLVDQMFPPVHRAAAPAFTDFNYWRAPMPAFDFDIPDLAPASPALSARSGDSKVRPFPGRGLASSLASTLSRRSSRAALTDTPPGRQASDAPLRPSSVAEDSLGEERSLNGDYDDNDDDARSESEGMPGSLPDDGDFERLRRQAAWRNDRARQASANGGAGNSSTEAAEYAEAVRRNNDYGDDDEHDDDDEDGDVPDDLDLDFSSVPYL